jgi:AraC-like DNA-binding protein
MNADASMDRLRIFIDVVMASLDDPDPTAPDALAPRVYLSRFHFDRLFKAGLLETPHVLRQRLLHERAGYV